MDKPRDITIAVSNDRLFMLVCCVGSSSCLKNLTMIFDCCIFELFFMGITFFINSWRKTFLSGFFLVYLL